MAAYRIKLSDGTTTLDLYGGTTSVMEGGLSMPVPTVKATYGGSPFSDGDEITAVRYNNRTITMRLLITGTSLSTLQTAIRSIHRLLNDAEKRNILGYGAQVYVEYQWGDSAGASVYFDVVRGDLILPRDYLSRALSGHYDVIGAELRLECKPLGRYTNQDIAQDTLENGQSAYKIHKSYLAGDDTDFEIDSANDMAAQTFTTVGAFDCVKASILCYRSAGNPGNVTIAIYDTSGGEPDSSLASETVSGNGLSPDPNYPEYLTITLDPVASLSATTMYAVVVSVAGADATNKLVVRYDNADATHAAGTRVSSIDGGTNWTIDANSDHLFAVFEAETMANYQDVTTAAAYGDVPAKMYIKLAATGATGAEKTWLAKRSGARYDDDLWVEGGDKSGFADLTNGLDEEVEDVGLEDWTNDTLNQWTQSGGTLTKNAANKKSGLYSADFGGTSAGQLYQDVTWAARLAGTSVTWKKQARWTTGAKYCRLTIDDGVDTTNGTTHAGNSAWAEITVTHTFNQGATQCRLIMEREATAGAETAHFDTADYVKSLITPVSGVSGGLIHRTLIIPQTALFTADQDVARVSYNFSTAPKGQFRVLIKCRVVCDDATDYDHLLFGFGYEYGDKVKKPTEANDEFYACAADSTWEILDLGALNIPPIAESDIASNNSFELRIYQYATENLTQNEKYYFDIDYIFLLPIDEGAIIIDDVHSADVLGIDGITQPNNIFIMDSSSNVEDYPSYVGKPFTLGRENTRILVLRDDLKTVTFTSDIKYQPQFLII